MTHMSHRAAIGIGSNVGDRLGNIRRSLLMAEDTIGSLISKSDVYESPPWGVTDQPRFLNACAVFETELSPHFLMSRLKDIESAIGRIERRRWGPREIDLDLLLYNDLISSDEALTVPHASMHERAFVLVPLSVIAPDWLHPKLGAAVSELLKALPPDETGDIVRIIGI